MSIDVIVKPSIFREYIGFKSNPNLEDFPVEIINSEIPEFHFILAFATEDYDPITGKGKGNFHATWNLSVEKIKKMKAEYQNVKVVISIGGRGTEYPFNPEEKLKWIHNARKSLEKLIEKDYKNDCTCITKTLIDGIDINYEHIESEDFAECIGEVINYLKKKKKGLVVSIAPSSDSDAYDLVLSNYKKLYKDNKHLIDWVDYQFYNQTVSTTHDFVNLYRNLSDFFHVKKLLAGFSTDPKDTGNISLEVFLEGCKQLIATASLSGIFVYNARDSEVLQDPYLVEKKTQNLLTGFD